MYSNSCIDINNLLELLLKCICIIKNNYITDLINVTVFVR